ncbi:U32 family peptidase [Acidiphilium sp. AL]|uniref:Ubiquinone biosynthesis protein UbiV n=1 Tax=Acidiphilium iwatense TaxID=768198 RepID=A0ABS9E1U5_9PROT|nr:MULTISPECIES: U32 family peptidase [Acidiphilium]MCF3947549.1 U32 family peptidase [Acidiphilium iwatense]MCU4161179.1 U32 family peptidase [Acidiphilium sp. AL]
MSCLTLGPLQFHWPAPRRRDFYARIADEAPVECVYLGEVVCSKRLPWFEKDLPKIAERLRRAGKQVVFSTPALIITDREVAMIRALCETGDLIEINDLACLQLLNGQAFVSGPLVNVFNEGTLDVLLRLGAIRVNTPMELSIDAIATLAAQNQAGEIEVFAFGRQPLAISQRCYHARAHDLHKDNCQFVCGQDADGLAIAQLDGRPLLAINGTQTLSHGHVALLDELADLQAAGVTHFRLSPHALDMVEIATLYRAVLDGTCDAEEGLTRLREHTAPVPFVNGYLHGRAGVDWQPGRAG